MSQTQVEGVLQVLLVVGTAVKDNGKGLGGVDTSSAGVKSKLSDLVFLVRSISSVVLRSTYRDADTVDTEITQTKNARAIGDDTNLRILARPVSEHSTNGLSLLDRDVQSLRASVNARVLQADITDCGGIDEGHELADVVDEETIEKVGILVLESGQVKVLVDRCLAGLNHLHGSGALGLEALHGVGEETSEVLGSAFLGCEGKSCTENC